MPSEASTRKRVYTYRRKGKSKRARKSNQFMVRYNNMRPGFPSTRLVKMRYVDTITITPGVSGILTSYLYAANGIYDPDITGTGHQPLGYDQWSLFYDHYLVVGSKLTCNFVSNVSNAPATAYGIYLDDNSTLLSTDANQIIEQGKAAWKFAANGLNTKGVVTVRNNYSARKFFNLTNVKDNRDQVGGPFGSNPNDIAYYRIFAQPLTGTDDINVQVIIDYMVLLSEPKELAQS